MKILFLSRWFPYPPDNGSKLRVYNLLKGLAEHHEVHLISFRDRNDGDEQNPKQPSCTTISTVVWKEFDPDSPRARTGLFSLKPRSLVDTYSSEMAKQIRRVMQTQRFDLIICSQWQMTSYRHLFDGTPALIEEIEIGMLYNNYTKATTPTSKLRHGLTWLKQIHYLRQLLAMQQPCTVVSEPERKLMQRIAPGNQRIHVIPNGVTISEYEGFNNNPIPGSLIFTGSFRYNPNYQAMLWFLEHVFPLIQSGVPEVQLTITGDHAGLPFPDNSSVRRTGYVKSVRPLLANAWASIVPLQIGGGTRLKILESAALRTPVISTTKGAEGLDLDDGRHILIADTPEEFARLTIHLLGDSSLRAHLSTNALERIRELYDWQVIMPKFLAVVEEAGTMGSSRSARPILYTTVSK